MNPAVFRKGCTDPSREDYRLGDIMSNIAKLSDDLILHILGYCCADVKFNSCVCGKLERFQAWPHWHLQDKPDGYVEPDMFLRFTHVDFIVEGKRSDAEVQSVEQIEKELLAYEATYGSETKTAILLALGGRNLPFDVFHDAHPVANAMVFYCSWSRLRRAVEKVGKDLESGSSRDKRILDEIAEALEYYGFHYAKGLTELENQELYEIDIKEF